MPLIRIPKKHWAKVWHFLLDHGPISRVSSEPEYAISRRHLELLRKKKLPFRVIEEPTPMNEKPRKKARKTKWKST